MWTINESVMHLQCHNNTHLGIYCANLRGAVMLAMWRRANCMSPDGLCTLWIYLHKGRAAVTPWDQESPWGSAVGPGARRYPHRAGSAGARVGSGRVGWCWDSQCTGGLADQTGDHHVSGRWKPWWFDLDRKYDWILEVLIHTTDVMMTHTHRFGHTWLLKEAVFLYECSWDVQHISIKSQKSQNDGYSTVLIFWYRGTT